MSQNNQERKSVKGYQILIIILAVILAAVSLLYFNQVKNMKQDFQVERDTLTSRLSNLKFEYDNVKTENDTMSYNLNVERERVDSLLQRLTSERSFNRAKIREYETKLGAMREVLTGYVKQIDSLNTLNKQLITENVEYRKQVTTERLRADKAEEKADELGTKVRKGAVIRAREIALVPLSRNDREVSRAARAERLRISFVLTANELAMPGERNVYVRVTGPDGYVLTTNTNALFNFEGDMITYTAAREVDYQLEDLSVSLFYNGSGITGGTYRVSVYMDGNLLGSNDILLR